MQLASEKALAFVSVALGLFLLVPTSNGDDGCRYMKSRRGLSGYENGGPYILDHFHLTKGRTGLREFLWKHWHGHMKGVAEANVGTVDRGIVRVLYIIQPDTTGRWGVDVELDRPMDPPCVTFRADSLVRLPILNPSDDISQTEGLWPPGRLPKSHLADSAVVNSTTYRIVLVRNSEVSTSDVI